MKLLCCLFCLLWAVSAQAQTGNEVLEKCQKAVHFADNNGGFVKDQFDEGWCFGWVNSVLSLDGEQEEWRHVTKARPGLLEFCIPNGGVPVVQGVRIVVKYLTDHPEQLHLDGMTVTVMALKDAFPCKS